MWLHIPSHRSNSSPASACSEKDCEPGSTTWASRIAPSATLNGKLTQPQIWSRACKKAAWMMLLCGPTLSPSTASAGAERWIASLPDSPVRICPSQESAQGSTVADPACSSKSHASPTIAVRGSSFWRTSQASLLPPPPLWTRPRANSKNARPPVSWENWPTSGGMRNGSLFQRPTWAPATDARDGSASRGDRWLTPHGMSGMEQETGKAGAGGEFAKQVTNWTTPSATDGEKGGPNCRGGRGDPILPGQACQWPTPAARDSKGTNSEQHALVTGGGRKHMDQLANFVAYSPLVQTIRDGLESSPMNDGLPQHSASKSNTTPRLLSRRLNPYFVEWLMGWPLGWTLAIVGNASNAAETASWRFALRSQLLFFFGEPALHREAA